MTQQPSERLQQDAEQLQLDSRRLLSRHYLAKIDRINEDKRLARFHAGHDVVRYYGAIRLIPACFLDAIFERCISVTMVKDRDLLVYREPRCTSPSTPGGRARPSTSPRVCS